MVHYIDPGLQYRFEMLRNEGDKFYKRPIELRELPDGYVDPRILGMTIPDEGVIWLRNGLDYRDVRNGRPHVLAHEMAHDTLPSPDRSNEDVVDYVGFSSRWRYV